MKLLYVSSLHPLQESDDLLTLDRLGIDWVSTGFYSRSSKPGDLPFIECKQKELLEELKMQSGECFGDDDDSTPIGRKNKIWTGLNAFNSWDFNKSFLEKFDCVFFNHFPENLSENIKRLRNVPLVIIKTYGMHGADREILIGKLKSRINLKIVRNNTKEHIIFGSDYAGHDAIIHNSVVRDEHEISGWSGATIRGCTFSSNFDVGDYLGDIRTTYFEQVKSKLKYPIDLYGVNNDKYCNAKAFIKHEEKIKILQNNRLNLVIGTPGSTNTYSFVEAWIMGQPIVCFGPKLWQSVWCEPADYIENGVTGFCCNKIQDLIMYARVLFDDINLAKTISENARKKAISIYGREVLTERWRDFYRANGFLLN